MNYYAFHIGDYSSATMHLSWDEDLAYRRLIDVYYMREAPLPIDRKQVYRLARATSNAQRKAIDTILNEFFSPTPDGFINARCQDELATVADKSRKAKSSAEARWRNASADANASETAMRTHSEGNAPNPNPNPNPSKEGEYVAREANSDADLERRLREAAGWQGNSKIHYHLAVTGPIVALMRAGADLDLDVLPIIRRDAHRCQTPNWNYFTKAIAQARDDRTRAATIVSPESHRGKTNGGTSSHSGRKPRSFVGEALAALGGEGHQGTEPSRD